MGDFILGHSDQGYLANYFVGGAGWSFDANLNEDMLERPLISAIARTTDASDMTLDIILSQPETVSVLGIINHNLSATATYQWIAYTDSGRLEEKYNSTVITVGSYSKNLSIKSTCIATSEADNTDTSYWTLKVSDPGNAYIQFGRLFMGERFYPNRNMGYGMKFGFSGSTTEITSSESGVDSYIDYKKKREVSMSFDLLDYTIGDEFLEVTLRNGLSSAMLFKFDSENNNNGLKTFICRNQSLSPLEFPNYNVNKMNISLIEVI